MQRGVRTTHKIEMQNEGEMTTQNLWSLYVRHFCGYDLAYCVQLMGEDLP